MTIETTPALDHLLSRYQAIREEHSPLPVLFRQSLENLGWEASQMDAWDKLSDEEVSAAGAFATLYRTGMAVAEQAENDTQAAYHNRDHTAEVMVSAEALAQAEPWSASQRKHQGLRLLVGAVSHDLGHTGAFGAPKRSLEEYSADGFSMAWKRFESSPRPMKNVEHDLVRSIILGTEFTEGPQRNAENQKREPERVQFRLQVLANDADILASVLPQTGPERGRLLSMEWAAAGPHAAAAASTVGTWAGRLGFLKAVSLNSRGAEALGATVLQNQEKKALESLGPAALQELPDVEARNVVLNHAAFLDIPNNRKKHSLN